MNFDGGMVIKSKKEHFLAHSTNKQKFVNMLSNQLQEAGCRTIHAEGDAEVLIAQTAVSSAIHGATSVIEDTDLLVLLCFHADLQSFPLFLYILTKGRPARRCGSGKYNGYRDHWVQKYAPCCHLSMQLEDVTQPRECSALGMGCLFGT